MNPSQRWVDESGGYLVCGPGEPLAVLTVRCGSCGKVLAKVAASTKPGGHSGGLLVRAFSAPDGWRAPAWRDGKGGKYLQLVCSVKDGRGGCRNTPNLSRHRILGEFQAMRDTPGSRPNSHPKRDLVI